MSKNIVIFSDGTGQEGGTGPDTNVYKLFKAVENRTPNQIAFYDRGLGTGRRWLTGKVSGAGISQNILECYQFIFDNYEAGDNIYLFGFSRGAATVRSLSGFIDTFGILPKSRPELINKAYKIYKNSNIDERTAKAHDFCQKHHTMWARVKFLGVWDTVAALGIPFGRLDQAINALPWLKHKFHNYSLSPSVSNAYHALSIDDERQTFHPTLWDEDLRDYQTMEQVWFAGVHTDVGGGYAETGMSDIPLYWMINNAVKHGLRIHSEDILKFEGNPDGTMHDSRGGKLSRFFRKKIREWPDKDGSGKLRGKPDIHPSVFLRTLDKSNGTATKYEPWILKYLE
ncbi:peptidoglycan-binding protein [Rhodobacterales bacterium 52_120_T64]|nr:peptidoglycan-binding protein [Rhodobacterales bacterium 52_120_T64]